MPDFGSYGIAQDSAVPDAGDLAPLIEQIEVRGFGVLPDLLRPEQVARLNAGLDEIYGRQCDEVGGEAALASMNDADVVRCPLAYADDFMALATHPTLLAVGRAMLGESFVLLFQNGLINRPTRRHAQASWHRDLNYQHWVCSKPLALTLLVCLEDFTTETGGTVFLPGSHLLERFPSAALVEQSQESPVARAGSVLVMNSMTFHRAGVNSSRRIRRAVNHVFGTPILAQQVDIPAMLDREPPSDPWLASYLGYRWNPMRDVAAWRRQRIALAARG